MGGGGGPNDYSSTHGRGESLRTPESDFVVYVQPLKKEQTELFKSHQLLIPLTGAFN